LNFSKGSVPVL